MSQAEEARIAAGQVVSGWRGWKQELRGLRR